MLAGLLLLAACERKKEAAPPPPPPSLKVATAVQKSVPLYGEFVGTLVGVKTVDIRARVEGFLAKREFVDGADVKEGQLLFVIDQRPFLAALAQAVAHSRATRPIMPRSARSSPNPSPTSPRPRRSSPATRRTCPMHASRWSATGRSPRASS